MTNPNHTAMFQAYTLTALPTLPEHPFHPSHPKQPYSPFGEQHTTGAEQEKSVHISNLQTHTDSHMKNNLACLVEEAEESLPFSLG